MSNLLNLSEEFRRLTELARDAVDEDGETPAELAGALAGLKMALPEKVEGLCYVMAQLEADEKLVRSEVDRLLDRAESTLKRRRGLERYLQTCMQIADVEKVKTPRWTATLVAKPPSVEILDVSHIPLDYIRVKPATYEPDKVAIARTLKNDEDVPGARLVYPTEKSLRIK